MAAVAVAQDPLSFEALTGELTALMREFPDQRTGKNSVYTMEEAALGAFALFWTQSPWWLDQQRSMQQTKGHSNA